MPRAAPFFPSYLLPPFPFRRKGTAGASPNTRADEPGTPPAYLSPHATTHTLHCSSCLADICHASQIISKGFHGRDGRAYLVAPFSDVPTSFVPLPHSFTPSRKSNSTVSASSSADGHLLNLIEHPPHARYLVTGAHTVADVSCRSCGKTVGWKYIDAKALEQRYKVGKYILEAVHVVSRKTWDNAGGGDDGEGVESMDTVAEQSPSAPSATAATRQMEKGKGKASIPERRRRDSGYCGSPPTGDGDEEMEENNDEDAGYYTESSSSTSTSSSESECEEDNRDDGPVEFDSQDEDECEDLFAGCWSAELAARRRRERQRVEREMRERRRRSRLQSKRSGRGSSHNSNGESSTTMSGGLVDFESGGMTVGIGVGGVVTVGFAGGGWR